MAYLQTLLSIELPIVQAPMAGVQGSALAVAVSNAGGLGSLPCAVFSQDAMRGELAAIKAQTTKPFNVNFFSHAPPIPDADREAAWRTALSPYYRQFGLDISVVPAGPGRAPFGHDAAQALQEIKPAVVSFHFGLPSADLLARVRAWGSKIVFLGNHCRRSPLARIARRRCHHRAGSGGRRTPGHVSFRGSGPPDGHPRTGAADRARRANAGHRGRGGIADAKGVAAALALGAAGAQIGTAFLLCPEATTSAVHRAALKGETARQTALTNLFTGRPARGIVNRLMKELGPISAAAPAFPLAAAALAPLRAEAERRGSGDFSPLWSGQNPSGCRQIPAAQLTRELAGEH